MGYDMKGIKIKSFSNISREYITVEHGMSGLVNKTCIILSMKIQRSEALLSFLTSLDNGVDSNSYKQIINTCRNLKYLQRLALGTKTMPDNVNAYITPFNKDYITNINDFNHNDLRKNTIPFKLINSTQKGIKNYFIIQYKEEG